MWIQYFLISCDEPITQQDLIEKMKFPKQTINSAVMKMANDGLLELRIIPGTRNRKTILLTEAGMALAKETVNRMLSAELRAIETMGTEQMDRFIELYSDFFEHLREAFQEEGLTDA